MIVDLKALSKEYIQENRQAKANYREGKDTVIVNSNRGSDDEIEVSYADSETRLRREPDSFPERYSSGPSNPSYGNMSSPYSQEPPMPSYQSPMYTTGPSYPAGTAYTMSPGMSMNATHGVPQGDPRYGSEYTYQQPPRPEYQTGYGYPSNSGYVSRGENMPQYYPASGANPPRVEETPRQYADYAMGGMPPNYGVPQRQNPSPYEPTRGDPYAARQQPPDPYTGSRRR